MLSVSSNNNLCYKSLSSAVGNISDLLTGILYCLPVKSLCVFKTVSKQWLSLISDPYFEISYNRHSCRLRMPALFMKKRLTNATGCATRFDFETLVMDERNGDCVPFNIPIAVKPHLKFEQSCNGLVLCQVRDDSTGYYPTYVIYNPSMKHCKTLPSPPFRKIRIPHVLSVTIAFDPSKSSYYQVVGVCSADICKDVLHIEIYSSKTDSWREAGDPFPFSSPVRLSVSGVYLNGSVHWINERTATLHYFDSDCELMKTVAMPTQPCSGGDYSTSVEFFGECRVHIHLMEMRKDDMPRADIWEMHMDYTGWNVKYYVDLSSLTTVYPSILLDRVYLFHRFELDVLLIEEGDNSSRLILLVLNMLELWMWFML